MVGGVMRSRLLCPEEDAQDIDLMLIGDLQSFAENVADVFKSRVVSINRQFDTVMIPSRKVNFELSGPRIARYIDDESLSLPSDPLERDLLLRDFTINALALPLSPQKGDVVDPAGGRKDIADRVIRTPIEADITIQEDPLRLMRAARFAAQLDFSVAPPLLKAMHRNRKLLAKVSIERITAELLKIISTPKPSIGLKLLYVTGILDTFSPELSELANLNQDKRHHHKNIFEHTLKVLDNVAENGGSLHTRLAALLHDIGKPVTRRYDKVQGWTFHGHEVIGERMVRRLGKSWKMPSSLMNTTSKLVRLHMRPINLTDEGVTDSAVRRLGFQVGEHIDDLITLCRADVTSSDPRRVKRYLANFERVVAHLKKVEEKDEIRAFQSPVRGEVIMAEAGLEPGPEVGKLKKMIEEAILDGKIPNDYDAALEYLRDQIGTGEKSKRS
ncbi:tRNA nucleotidyltransferase [candidate division LCP-89 bacterium B3_LCP]|uniref:tRNA nucleotidyltransferase n=1 Tax=candidate division LCP-89 bacterium B3_LCP TaxID=2012998 RepID=A0A532V2P9_UNCL8|nr:MAG: tRNA nucleotidyltransferase [candidate division LCP-89 bacterium B3_LCP]